MTEMIRYEILIKGHVSQEYTNWFDDVHITSEEQEDGLIATRLVGEVIDQSALHGLLNRIRDLGLVLLSIDVSSVNPIDD